MIDYTHFAEQAEKDILRSEKLYAEGDYAFAIFSAQQGLEKYLKSYILKKEIFEKPKDLGHLAYHAILGKVVTYMRDMNVLYAEYPDLTLFIQTVVNLFDNHHKLFEKLNRSESLQIVFWKASLCIPLMDDEKKMINEFMENLGKGFQECKMAQQTAFTKITQISISQKNPIQFSDKDEKEISEIISKLFGQNPQQYDMPELYGRFLELITPYWIKSDPNSEKSITLLTKYSALLKIFSMNDLVEFLQAFAHEQISRYPTSINDSDSMSLYTQRKNELGQLIERIKAKCEKYKEKIR